MGALCHNAWVIKMEPMSIHVYRCHHLITEKRIKISIHHTSTLFWRLHILLWMGSVCMSEAQFWWNTTCTELQWGQRGWTLDWTTIRRSKCFFCLCLSASVAVARHFIWNFETAEKACNLSDWGGLDVASLFHILPIKPSAGGIPESAAHFQTTLISVHIARYCSANASFKCFFSWMNFLWAVSVKNIVSHESVVVWHQFRFLHFPYPNAAICLHVAAACPDSMQDQLSCYMIKQVQAMQICIQLQNTFTFRCIIMR